MAVIAGQLEIAETAHRQAMVGLRTLDVPEGEEAAPFAPLVRLARKVGVTVGHDDVHVLLAFGMALLVKVALPVLLWVVAPRLSDFAEVRDAFRRSVARSEKATPDEAPTGGEHGSTTHPLDDGTDVRLGGAGQRKKVPDTGGLLAMFDEFRQPIGKEYTQPERPRGG